MAETFSGRAIVSHGPLGKAGWKLEQVSTTRDIEDDELIVEIIASGTMPLPDSHSVHTDMLDIGICHTDVMFGTAEPPFPFTFYPRIMGHEGIATHAHPSRSSSEC